MTTKKQPELSAQGVRILPSSGTKHTHRFTPETTVTRAGNHITRMKCYCGTYREESASDSESA